MSKTALILKGFLVVLLLGMLANLIILDWREVGVGQGKVKEEEIPSVSRMTPVVTPKISQPESSPSGEKVDEQKAQEEICPQACLLAIDKAAQISAQGSLSSPTSSPSAASSVKIFYLPLGSGSTKSQDWADSPGLSSYIDPVNYGKVKSIIFEASLRIPTANGRIYARLLNKNDVRPVWFSEISSEGSTSTLIQSSPITFEPGNKLYQVQAKTTMGYEAIIDFARVKFITE